MVRVGDAHRRISGRPVTLGRAGINGRGRRSQELRLNYRTTAAICRWSLGALGRTVGPVFGSFMFQAAGHQYPFFTGGAVMLVVLLILSYFFF